MKTQTHVLKPGDQLGPYQVIRLIGSGGMGEVYEALEPAIQRKVALKVINEKGLESDEMVQRFLGEAKALAKLNHPNVVNLLSFGQIEKQYYMAMEFIDGVGLDEFIKRSPYGIDETLKIFRQLLDGMQSAHMAAIVHRDLKPQNIIIDKDKNVKIIDFGIAKMVGDQDGYKTATGMFLGTLNYLAPEIARGYPPGHQTDIYGMGVILYEMVTGRVPFTGKNSFETLEQIRNKPIEFPKKIELLLPDNVKRLIIKMTAKKLTDRYGAVADVIEDLNKVNLDDLPSELKIKSVRTRKVVNFEEIQKKMRAKKFEDPEIKMIVNIACDIQAELDFDSTATLVVAEQEEIELSDRAIAEAMERFSFVRSDLSNKRLIVDQAATRTHAQFKQERKESPLTLALTIGVVVLLGGGIFWKTVLRKPANAIAVSKPSTGPTVVLEPSQSEPQARPPTQSRFPDDSNMTEDGLTRQGKQPLMAHLPKYKVGEKFEYFVRSIKSADGSDLKEDYVTWTVSQDLGEDYAWLSGDGMYRVTKRNPFPGPTQVLSSRDGNDYSELKLGDIREPFPLVIGKSATYELVGKSVDERTKWRYKRTCTVAKYVPQTIKLGKFWTYQVECRQDNDPVSVDTYYYSPTARTTVVQITRYRDASNKIIDKTSELRSFTPANRLPAGK